jgi:PAS domain S-box-containing protein
MVTVLLVEDESIVAKDVKERLKNLGYTISAVAASGEKALEKVREHPDVVLMDIVLKGDMDGITAAGIIRSQFNIPVIYMTSHADDRLLERAKVTEPYGYILKPVEDKELYTTINIALHNYEMEKKVRESSQWLSTTLKSIGEGVITVDTEGVITFLNPAAAVLTGWGETEAVGALLTEVVHLLDTETRTPFNKGRSFDCTDSILVAKDGTEKIVEIGSAPIADGDRMLGAVVTIRDITEKRQRKKEMIETQKLESLSILAGGIAHDFNNILTAILGNIYLAKMYAATDKIIDKLVKIEKASLQARVLIQQLLTFSRRGAPVKKVVRVNDLIRDSANFVLKGSNVTCHIVVPDGLWAADCDTVQIFQVMSNIIMNAVQAMPEGGTLTIKAENISIKEDTSLKKGKYVKITVTDEGVGIPSFYLEQIFEPYFTTNQKRSGLGLATAYAVVKNHGGHITVESEVGVGTTFSIWLPAFKEEKESVLRGGKGKILLMDDEESILEAAGELLELLGHTVVTVRNGEEAVCAYEKALNKEPFDVVVMDLDIPGGMGGKQTIQKLLEIDPSVKAVVSSGYSDDPIMVNYRAYGFCSVVTKPYTAKELSETLYNILND